MEKKRKKARKDIDRNYFTCDTQDAIIRYVQSTDQIERERLYKEHIEHAFNKLIEILIHKGKFYYAGPNTEEIKSDVIMHLLEKLNNYKPSKGKAYSYFTVVVWRFLINLNSNNYQKIKNYIPDESIGNKIEEDYFVNDNHSDLDRSKFFDEFIIYLDNNLARVFPRKKDINIANAILEIIKRRDNIKNLNKKAIYIYIREMTNCKSSQIASIMNAFKIVYNKAWEDFMENGCLSDSKLYR